MDLSVTSRQNGEHTVVSVVGEIDVYTAPRLREHLDALVVSDRPRLVVDLGGVDFLDSTGLGVLVGTMNQVRARQGSLALVCAHEKVLKVFRITGLTKIFPIRATLADAYAVSFDVTPVTD